MTVVELTGDGPVRRLTFAQPARLNPLGPQVLAELTAHCTALQSDDDVRVVVVEGQGRSFSAGADLRAPSGAPNPTWSGRRRSAAGWQRLLDQMEALPQVTVARIQGWCIGGAVLVATACDIRIASENARFSIPELALGIPLTWGGLPRLVREIGLPRTRDFVMTGRAISASEALAWGLVTRVAADDRLDEAVQEAVEQLLAMPRAPLEMTKDALTAIGRPALATAWADPDLISWAGGEPERLEAARAYVARNLGKKS